MKNDKQKQSKKQERNHKAASILRSLDDKQLATVAGGGCRTCGIMVSLDGQVKALS